MDKEEVEAKGSSSLFPLFAVSAASPSSSTDKPNNNPIATLPPGWLCNTSFTTDLSLINDAVASLHNPQPTAADGEDFDDQLQQQQQQRPLSTSYELLQGEGDEEGGYYRRSDSGSDAERERRKTPKRRKHKKKRKRSRDDDEDEEEPASFASRKSNVRAWADSNIKPSKDYYLDTHGDRDNLVYGCLYRMDVPRYKPYNASKISGFHFQGLYRRGSIYEKDSDADALETSLKSDGRYWSAKYSAVERHKSLKRLRILAPKQSAAAADVDGFIPLSDNQIPHETVDHNTDLKASVVEESWEDEVLRKTREYNKSTRERPHDEKVWLEFAEFQDRVASMQPRKGARLQMLEKKVSILEKATELNPDNEELLLSLMKAYQGRDNTDLLIGRWEKVLMHHSGSIKLWKEYLRVFQGEFSRFKVSDMRKMYAHAIQALSTACSRQYRQVYQNAQPSCLDPDIVQLELGLVDIFLSLCRFEWQVGCQELATALFQAELEFSLFCPSLLLSENSKLRLFEHFWNSDDARVGEEGAVGWSTWLEKEEENRQRVMKEDTSRDDEGGRWTGWSEPISKLNETVKNAQYLTDSDLAAEELEQEFESEEIKQDDDTEVLLKQLGIDVDAGVSTEVKDTSTWIKWSEEESLRDRNQWMPVRGKSGRISQGDGTPDGEADEQILRVILFEDVREYLFSLSSSEARLSLVFQFIEFFDGEMSQRICTNCSSWNEKILSLEVLPVSIMQNLRRGDNTSLNSESSSSGNSLELLLCGTSDSSKRADMMKFLRNAILLCLTIFPRNYVLQEAALVAEESAAPNMDACTPCRPLAKLLLKSDRQDVLLCGVYAQREAASNNVVHARRVFDMALSSVEGLPSDLQFNAPLLYFWYAEMELGNSTGTTQESSARALHILSCLGSGTNYSAFECKPSRTQLLRARQGFKERMRTVRSSWVHGVIDDQSVALTCSAALFEELTTGWAAGIEVLDDAFGVVLPDRRSHSYQLEFLFNYYVRILLRNHKQSSLSKAWESTLQGLQIYPSNPELLKSLVEISYHYTTPNKLRWTFDDYCQKKPSVIVLLFALSFEMSRGGSQHRIHALFERALANEMLRSAVIIWRMYISYEIDIAHDPLAAKRIFFRAVHACPWSKRLWLDAFSKLHSILTAKEFSDLQEVMRDKELNLRTDIYEILLQDELVS